jgi:outer membrane protein insertion porin family
MRVSSAAIFTLATLAASNVTQQANAAPTQTTNQENKTATTDVVVVPYVESQENPVINTTNPETTYAIEFSSQPVSQQIIVQNNTINNRNNNNNLVTDANLFVTATNVQIIGANSELEQIIRKVIKTQTGGETSQNQLQQDVDAILKTGLFASANVNSSITSTGLDVVYQVKPIVAQAIQLSGAKVLSYTVALENFKNQIGKDISPAALEKIVQQINQWYKDNGYSLARVLSIQPSRQGVLTVNVAEGVVGDVKFRFANEEGQKVDNNGNPIKGRTKEDFLRQQLKLKPGKVFADDLARQDVQTLYRLGLFKSVNVAF